MLRPTLRHVSTCLRCGWRQATRLQNSYPAVCLNGCGHVEHLVVPFDSAAELTQVRRDGQIRRLTARRGTK